MLMCLPVALTSRGITSSRSHTRISRDFAADARRDKPGVARGEMFLCALLSLSLFLLSAHNWSNSGRSIIVSEYLVCRRGKEREERGYSVRSVPIMPRPRESAGNYAAAVPSWRIIYWGRVTFGNCAQPGISATGLHSRSPRVTSRDVFEGGR